MLVSIGFKDGAQGALPQPEYQSELKLGPAA